MVLDIKSLKKIRKSFNLTQHQFAKQCGVSQSLIAKIESKKLDPTYSKVLKIEDAINRLAKHEGIKVNKIMVKTVVTTNSDQKIIEVSKILRKRGISQIPVLEKGHIVGLLTESAIIDKIGSANITNLLVKDLMTEAPPRVSENTNVSIVSSILKHFPLLLVITKGKLVGIVTKADLLKVLT